MDEQGQQLRYYKDPPVEGKKIKLRGTVDLAPIKEVRSSLAPKAPQYALDLVSDTHVYTVIASTKEEMIAWAVVLSKASKVEAASDSAANEVVKALGQ